MTLRWGILGPGAIARNFAKDLAIINERESALCERDHYLHHISAVASSDRKVAVKFAEEFSTAKVFDSYHELLASDEVDVVYIANVQSLHHQTTLQALSAGKHVLCEKPFALSAKQAREMIDLATKSNLFLMEAMWMRFLPHIKNVLEQIQSGAIGDILAIRADHGQWVYRKKNHRLLDPRLGGGALLDLGIYPIALTYALLGKPEEIISAATFTKSFHPNQSASSGSSQSDKSTQDLDVGVNAGVGVVDSAVALIFRYPNNALASLHTTIESSTATVAEISGTLGRIEIDRSFYAPTSFRRIMHNGEIYSYENPWHGSDYLGLGEEAEEVRRCIEAGLLQSPVQSHQVTLDVMEILDEIRGQIGLTFPGEI
jgi:predicted dehydrogenase